MPTTTNEPRGMPLSGVRVLDLSNLLAGPMATMLLADFGADVIKVEHPERGDELRQWGYSKDEVGLFFKLVNRNKKMITLNLGTDEGQALVREIARHCDVLVESFRPGRLEEWGLGYEALRAENPQLVMARISGFGQTGPYSTRPGFGTVLEAMSGYVYITGFEDRPPLLPAFALADSTAAIFAALGVMLALYRRDRDDGTGQVIDLGLYEGLLTLLGSQVVNFDQLGIIQERAGRRLPFVAGRNTFLTADEKWVAIAGSTQATFERMSRALDIPHIVDDPRFSTTQRRLANSGILDEIIQDAVRQFTRSEALSRLIDADAVAGPVYNVQEIFEDPHFRERRNIVAVPDEDLGQIRMQDVVPRLSVTPGSVRHAAARKGKHNEEVFRGLLGLDDHELKRLHSEGVI